MMTNEELDTVIMKITHNCIATQLQIEALLDILNPIQKDKWMKSLKSIGNKRGLNVFTGESLLPNTTNEQIHKEILNKFY